MRSSAWLPLAALGLASCAPGAAPAGPLRAGGHAVLIVGRVEIYPPLSPEEQHTPGLRDTIYLTLDNACGAPDPKANFYTFHKDVKAKLEQFFFVERPRVSFCLSDAMIPM